MPRISLLVALFVLLPQVGSAEPADIFDPINCWAEIEDHGPFTVAPCGSEPAPPRIDVYLFDILMRPVEVVATDIWLDSASIVWCNGADHADSSTYSPDPGHTTLTMYDHASIGSDLDCEDVEIRVIAVGMVIEILVLAGVNSPDFNGDMVVTLGDFALFASAFQGHDPCMDLYESGGNVSIADFALFASYFNQCSCR